MTARRGPSQRRAALALQHGNHRAEELRRPVSLLERETGRKAIIELAPMQPGDVAETYADIEAFTRDLGFTPRTTIDEGVPKFVAWFRQHYGMQGR